MDNLTYSLTKKIAASALSGVKSMSVEGQTLKIVTNTSGTLTMTFPSPKDGLSVTDIDVNANNQIVFTMSDGTEHISGKIPTVKGDKGDAFTYDDFTPEQLESLKGADGYTPVKDVDYFDGQDGFSPSAKIEKVGDTATITITDKDGTTTATIKDGQGGSGGSGEENKIEVIKVNGIEQTISADKSVDITVPTVTNDLTDELKTAYDDAVTAKHTHENDTVLDGITAEKVAAWDKAEENVQSDWNETDETADGFIKNKPEIPTVTNDLTNELKADYDSAVTAKHTHENADVLDGITSDDISQITKNKDAITTLNGTGEGSVDKKIADKLSEQTYLTKEIATADEVAAYIADPTTAKFNVIYLVKDDSVSGSDKYYEYQRIGNEELSTFEMTGSTSTDLSDYTKTEDLSTVATSGSYNDLSDLPEFETVDIDFTTEY